MLARAHQQLFVTVRRDRQSVPRWAQFTIKVSYNKTPSESDVYRRQILASEDGHCTEKIQNV